MTKRFSFRKNNESNKIKTTKKIHLPKTFVLFKAAIAEKLSSKVENLIKHILIYPFFSMNLIFLIF